jgi:hypothetical protein
LGLELVRRGGGHPNLQSGCLIHNQTSPRPAQTSPTYIPDVHPVAGEQPAGLNRPEPPTASYGGVGGRLGVPFAGILVRRLDRDHTAVRIPARTDGHGAVSAVSTAVGPCKALGESGQDLPEFTQGL